MTTEAAYELAISRIFDAPRELVYQAFVDPDQLSQWFGPVGFSVPRDSVTIEPRPGGRQKFVMVSDEDPTFTSGIDAVFTEVVENELLMAEQDVTGIPGTSEVVKMAVRLEFYDEPGGRTRLELRQGPFSQQMEIDTRAGWMSSFTRLDEVLAAAQQ